MLLSSVDPFAFKPGTYVRHLSQIATRSWSNSTASFKRVAKVPEPFLTPREEFRMGVKKLSSNAQTFATVKRTLVK